MTREDKFDIKTPYFDAMNWTLFLDEYKQVFTSTCSFLTDEAALNIHKEKIMREIEDRRIKQIEENPEMGDLHEGIQKALKEKGFYENIIDLKIIDIAKAEFMFYEQTMVVLCSIIEALVEEIFMCIFSVYPQRMYKYISYLDKNGYVSLKDVVNAPSKDKLLLYLADSATDNATSGKFKKQMERMQELCDNSFNNDLLSDLNDIIVIRNEIVHDISEKRYGLFEGIKAYDEGVLECFRIIDDFIVDVRNVLQKEGIDVFWEDD